MLRKLLNCCWTWAALLVGLGGCGTAGPPLVVVSGQVSFDGQPLEQGEIIFRAPGEASYAGQIVKGKYSVKSTTGQKQVEIFTHGTPTARSVSGSGEAEIEFEARIPPQYNSQSTLTANITPDGENEFDFRLTP